MNFKQFLIREFNKKAFYDFYALHYAKTHPNVQTTNQLSSTQNELDNEIKHKLIEKGNQALYSILDDVSLIIFSRYLDRMEFSNEFKAHINPDTPNLDSNWYRNWNTVSSTTGKEWIKLTDNQKIKVLEKVDDYIERVYPDYNTWGLISKYCLKLWKEIPIVNNLNTIVQTFDTFMSFVHNNGNLLQFQPDLEKELHTRDVASPAYIVSKASPEIRNLIRSSVGYLGQPEEIHKLQILEVALRKAVNKPKYKKTSLQIKPMPKHAKLIRATLRIPNELFFKNELIYNPEIYKKIYKKLQSEIGNNSESTEIYFSVNEYKKDIFKYDYTINVFLKSLDIYKTLPQLLNKYPDPDVASIKSFMYDKNLDFVNVASEILDLVISDAAKKTVDLLSSYYPANNNFEFIDQTDE